MPHCPPSEDEASPRRLMLDLKRLLTSKSPGKGDPSRRSPPTTTDACYFTFQPERHIRLGSDPDSPPPEVRYASEQMFFFFKMGPFPSQKPKARATAMRPDRRIFRLSEIRSRVAETLDRL